MSDLTEVRRTPDRGQFLVAKKDIEAGTVIVYEKPLVIGPKQLTRPLCLGCHLLADVRFRCKRCGWPVCSSKCEESPYHKQECALLSRRRLPEGSLPRDSLNCCPFYQCITPLRFLLNKQPALRQLETHSNLRHKLDISKAIDNNIIQFMRKYLQIDEFSEKEIHDACSSLDVNAFDVPLECDVRLRAIYANGSLINHSCTPNTRPVITKDFELKMVATVDIKAGETIFITYAQSLQNTIMRQTHLEKAKHFRCDCARCLDKTEKGIHVGSFKCPKCLQLIHSKDPTNVNADWECANCGYILKGSDYNAANTVLRTELKKSLTIPSIEKFIQTHENGSLHPKNGIILEAKHALLQLYSRHTDLTLKKLEELKLICDELLEVASILEPGQTKLRAELLTMKYNTLSQMSQIKAKFKRTKKESEELQKLAQETLRLADSILSLEASIISVM